MSGLWMWSNVKYNNVGVVNLVKAILLYPEWTGNEVHAHLP